MRRKQENWISIERARILWLIKKNRKNPLTISGLCKETGLKRTTIYYHLEILNKHNLITERKEEEETGQPVFINTNKAAPINWDVIDNLVALWKKPNK